jgi:tetratricopeptide (TPR) repeat protein
MTGPEASIPRDTLTVAISSHEKAIVLREAMRFAEAERHCRIALAGYESSEGPLHPDVANALVELGQILEGRDHLRDARRCHVRALAILTRATARGPLDPDLGRLRVRARVFLGGVERALGAYAAADRLYVTALADARQQFGANDPDVAGILNNLGVLRKYQGRFAEAIRFYNRALALLDPERDQEALATLYHNLGGIEHARGRFAAGEPHARRSVELREAVLGSSHPVVAADVAALAALVDGSGRLDEAAPLYLRALAVFRRKLGVKSSEVGLNLSNLAVLRQRQGRLAEAEELYAQALEILEQVYGRGHPEVALTVNNLADLVRETGDLRRAEGLYARALRSFERSLGARHPHTKLCRANHRALKAERATAARKAARAGTKRASLKRPLQARR